MVDEAFRGWPLRPMTSRVLTEVGFMYPTLPGNVMSSSSAIQSSAFFSELIVDRLRADMLWNELTEMNTLCVCFVPVKHFPCTDSCLCFTIRDMHWDSREKGYEGATWQPPNHLKFKGIIHLFHSKTTRTISDLSRKWLIIWRYCLTLFKRKRSLL